MKYEVSSDLASIMTTEFITLHAAATIGEAIKRTVKRIDSETIETCYVTDSVRHLIGLSL